MKSVSQDSAVTSTQETFLGNECPSLQNNFFVKPVDPPSITSVSCSTTQVTLGAKTTSPNPPSEECKLTQTFPWIVDFRRLCQKDIGLTNIRSLENLMTVYQHYISPSAAECYLKPNRASKLKKNMNDTLLLFHLFYSDIKKPLKHHSSYLDKMSDLMAVYIDMEITASRRGKESLLKIACKLTSALFLFLDKSQDHILDSILKTKFMKKNHLELCNYIFSRVLRDSPGRALHEMTYVRYVFAFKMWKWLVRGVEEKKNIMKLASLKLHPPPQFKEKVKAGLLSGILPKIPKSREDITMFLMEAKFCVNEKTEAFLKEVSDPKLQGVFSTHVDFNSALFYINDKDITRRSLGARKDDQTSSSMVMNDIWSRVSGERDIAHQIRLSNIMKTKKVKNKKQKVKCKKSKCEGLTSPVFKKVSPQDHDLLGKNKKKKILKEKKMVKAVKPYPTVTSISKVCTDPVDIPKMGPPTETGEPVVDVQSMEVSCDRLVETIKNEPIDTCEESCISFKGTSDAINQTKHVSENRMDLVNSVKIEGWKGDGSKIPQCWESQSNTEFNERKLEKCAASSQDNQKLITEIATILKEQGRFPKSESKVHPHPSVNLPPEPSKTNLERSKLHDHTLRSDFNIFMSQQKFRYYCLNHSDLPGIPVPSPYDVEDTEEGRCMCHQCRANLVALITNLKILTQYTESMQSIEEGPPVDTSSCLPLKKRKNIPISKEEKNFPNNKEEIIKQEEVSYPPTPMLSIAVFEESKCKGLFVHKKKEKFAQSCLEFPLNRTFRNCSSKLEGLVPIKTAQLDLGFTRKTNEHFLKSSLELSSNGAILNCQPKQEGFQRLTPISTPQKRNATLEEQGVATWTPKGTDLSSSFPQTDYMSDFLEVTDCWIESKPEKENEYALTDFFGNIAEKMGSSQC